MTKAQVAKWLMNRSRAIDAYIDRIYRHEPIPGMGSLEHRLHRESAKCYELAALLEIGVGP